MFDCVTAQKADLSSSRAGDGGGLIAIERAVGRPFQLPTKAGDQAAEALEQSPINPYHIRRP